MAPAARVATGWQIGAESYAVIKRATAIPRGDNGSMEVVTETG
jgi:hypothetical protein